MASAVIGALRVILGADTAAFDKGLKTARGNLSSFGKDITKIASGIGLERALESAISGLVGGLKQAFTSIDDLGKTAQKIGVPIEELSKMQYAAELSGVSLEGLSKGMGKLAQTMFNSTKSGMDPAAQALKRLGVSAIDSTGALRPTGDVMIDLAGAFAVMEDGAVKTALSMQIFGKAGKDMIPLLNTGKEGLKDLAKEAEAFGLVISQRTFVATEAFNDNLTKLSKIGKGVANVVVRELAPSLMMMSGLMVESAVASGFVETAGKKVADAIFDVTKQFLRFPIAMREVDAQTQITAGLIDAFALDLRNLFAPAIDFVIEKLGTLADKIANLPRTKFMQFVLDVHTGITTLGFAMSEASADTIDLEDREKSLFLKTNALAEAFPLVTSQVAKYAVAAAMAKKESQNLDETFEQVRNHALMLAADLEDKLKNRLAAVGGGAKGAANALDQFLSSQAKSIAGQQAEAMAVGLTTGAKERLKLVMEAEAIAAEKGLVMTQAQITKMTELANKAAETALRLKGATITEETLAPWEKYRKQIFELDLMLEKEMITLETYNKKAKKVAEETGASWGMAATSIAGSFTEIADAFGGSQSKIGKAAKIFAAAVALINVVLAQTYALAGPFPYNLVAAALVAAKGAALIAAIKGANTPKMATGGALTPNAFGGRDSTLMQARVRPDEQIDIWRPGEGPDPRRGAGGMGREIVIRVDEISRATVEKLIPALNSAMGDGYKLKMAG